MSLTSLYLLSPGAPVWVQALGPVCLPLSKCNVSVVPPWRPWEAPQPTFPPGRTSIPKSQQEIHLFIGTIDSRKVISWAENSFSAVLLMCSLTPGELLSLSDPRIL